jgi:NADH-quinone oxidoreductase subunit G/NADP-reducing hydrogenase subunit HndD
VVPSKDKNKHCILCGQCAVHCPVSAAQEQTSWEIVAREIADKKKVVVVQFAPSIRVSIGEDFGLPYGKIMTGHLVAGLRALGFKYVFDVNFGADVTTIVEAEELIERLHAGKGLPMFTSCCPGWINYVEHYRPDLIPNLTASRPPQIHGGGIIKTYWAQKMKINPKDVVVVSIMPCTAKKYEASRKEMKINGNFPVDYVLTTRELSFMLKKNKIDLGKLEKAAADDPLAEFTGGGAIFGASGGVMESALRTAQYLLSTAQSAACSNPKTDACQTKIDFHEVQGMGDFKEATVDVAGTKLKVAVLNGIGNIQKLLDKINEYHYIEVMACPGGCIGGGGQPIPTTPEIRQKRLDALYALDKSCAARISYENKSAQAAMAWLKENNLEDKVLFTGYKKKSKY